LLRGLFFKAILFVCITFIIVLLVNIMMELSQIKNWTDAHFLFEYVYLHFYEYFRLRISAFSKIMILFEKIFVGLIVGSLKGIFWVHPAKLKRLLIGLESLKRGKWELGDLLNSFVSDYYCSLFAWAIDEGLQNSIRLSKEMWLKICHLLIIIKSIDLVYPDSYFFRFLLI